MSKPESKCPECGGTGVVILLTSRRPCLKCTARNDAGAAGAVPSGPELCFAETRARLIEDGWTTVTEYDALGRVTRLVTNHPPESAGIDDASADAPPPEDGAPGKPE